jgi:hypothetical protein
MCNMDKIPAYLIQRRFILILSICLGSLLILFFAESFSPAWQSLTMEWIDHGEKDGPNHEAGGDSFVFPKFTDMENPQGFVRIACQDNLVCSSLPSVPLLPPPIAA